MSYWQVMQLPYRAFLLMNASIMRLLAEKDTRALDIAVASQSAEGMKAVRNHLNIELGEVSSSEGPISEERDQEGFDALRAWAG